MDVVHSLEEQDPPRRSARKGGWRAIKYILGNESFEKLASMSLIANIAVYLQSKYNMGGVSVVNVISVWSGSSNIVSLAGAFLADAYLGRFRTLLFGSIASFLGMGTITLTATLPSLRPSACKEPLDCPKPQTWQLGILFTGLGLLAVGAGGIRPCNIAFGADQFDSTTEKGKAQLESFFNWWYFSFTVALVIALTAVVYIQTNVSWPIGFLIPTVCLGISISIFLIGRHTYIYMKRQGSVFSDMAKVIAAACRKRHISIKPGSELRYYDASATGSQPQITMLAHADRFKLLDKAALITDPSEMDEQGIPKNNWRLCSLQQVEYLKCFLAVVPVWVTGIACFMLMDQQSTFGMLQAIQMNKSIGSKFKVPPGWMNLTGMIALSLWILIYERLYIPAVKKVTRKDKRLTMKQRIEIGIVMSVLCVVVAGVVEKRRRDSALKHGSFTSPVSVAMLLPQFALSGLTEAFAAVAIMEFLTRQMPDNMRTVAGAIFFLNSSIASYISSFLVNIIHSATKKNGKSPWLGGHDLNNNRLEYYYYVLAGIASINLVYFRLFACRYIIDGNGRRRRRELQLQSAETCESRNICNSATVLDEGTRSFETIERVT